MPRRRRRLDPISVLEAAYTLDGTDAAWLKEVLVASAPGIDCGSGAVAFTTDLAKMVRGEFDAIASTLDGDPTPMLVAINTNTPPAIVALLTRRAWTYASMSELLAPLREEERDAGFTRKASPFAVADAVGLFAQDGEGGILNVTAPARGPATTTKSDRAQWAQLAVHLTAMMRLRRRLRPVEAAVLAPDGRLAHAEGDARKSSRRERLVSAVRARERARGRLRDRAPDEALAMWRGLVDGRWSLVDRFESDRSRWIVAFKNAPSVVDPRRLSDVERQVVHYAARGASNKEIAYALGLAISTVADALARACRKLRVRRRVELAAFAAAPSAASLDIDGITVGVVEERPSEELAPAIASRLTATELAVAKLAARGASDAEIAAERGTSVRTASNQLARIYKKLAVHSRSELARALHDADGSARQLKL